MADNVSKPVGNERKAWAGPQGCLALAMFQMPNRFYEASGRVMDFIGNDCGKAWVMLLARPVTK